MAKHRLIISKDTQGPFPARSDAGQLQVTRTLVVNWKGAWDPRDRPAQCLVVAPGDELEFALESEQSQGGSFWIHHVSRTLLLPGNELPRQDNWEQVDIERESKRLQINPALADEPGELRYELRITALGQRPLPIVGQGQPGSLTATRP